MTKLEFLKRCTQLITLCEENNIKYAFGLTNNKCCIFELTDISNRYPVYRDWDDVEYRLKEALKRIHKEIESI